MHMKTRSVFSCLLFSALSMLAVRAADQLEGRAVDKRSDSEAVS
jgi:hypothetical protein